jgi:hypothetical protein
MTRREVFLRVYSQADWIAHVLLATCIVAVINLLDVFSQMVERATAVRTVDGFEVTACYFGPPTPFYPRLIVAAALLIAVLAAFGQTVSCRFISSAGLAAAMAAYVFWWFESYQIFHNFEEFAGIRVLTNPEIKKFAYLYAGTPADLAIALSIAVCLVMMLDRLFYRAYDSST